MTVYETSIKNGCALLYEFIFAEEIGLEVIKIYDEYCDISKVHMGEFTIVETEEGLKGVVCAWNGEVIISAEYISLEFKFLQTEEESDKEIVLFKLQNKNEIYETFIWEI